MTLMKFLVFTIACGAIEPRLVVVSYFVILTIAVYYFHPAMVRLIFIHGMAMVRIILM